MLTVVDMVRRAKIDIDMVAIGDQRVVKSSHGVCITADRLLDEADFAEAQMLICRVVFREHRIYVPAIHCASNCSNLQKKKNGLQRCVQHLLCLVSWGF